MYHVVATKNRELLESYSQQQLHDFTIAPEKRALYGGCSSVAELIKNGSEQVKKYEHLLSIRLPQEKQIYKFVVVQVGFPLVVEQIE